MLLDANILVKLVTEEEGSKQAEDQIQKAFTSHIQLSTLDIALSEALNAIWKHHILHKDITYESFLKATNNLLALYDLLRIINLRIYVEEAVRISVSNMINFYDSLYIASAKLTGDTFFTADRRLHKDAQHLAKILLLMF